MRYMLILYISFHCASHGSATYFTINPTNVTTCLGNSAVFMCATDQPATGLSWFINDKAYTDVVGAVKTDISTSQSCLTVPTIVHQVSTVQCYFLVLGSPSPQLSSQAFLYVQAPPSAPTNVSTNVLNTTAIKLLWEPYTYFQSTSSVTFFVVVTNKIGVVVYNATVRETQVIITAFVPCDHYEAVITAQNADLACVGNSTTISFRGICFSTVTVYGTSATVFQALPTATSLPAINGPAIGVGVGVVVVVIICTLLLTIWIVWWKTRSKQGTQACASGTDELDKEPSKPLSKGTLGRSVPVLVPRDPECAHTDITYAYCAHT